MSAEQNNQEISQQKFVSPDGKPCIQKGVISETGVKQEVIQVFDEKHDRFVDTNMQILNG